MEEGPEHVSYIGMLKLCEDTAKWSDIILKMNDNLMSIVPLLDFKDIARYAVPGMFLWGLFLRWAWNDLGCLR